MSNRVRIVIGVVVALVVIQLVPVDRSNPPATGEIEAPADVMGLLERSCYDCHSGETRWPWYSRIAPVSWLVAHDVAEGREHVDFSSWKQLPPGKRAHALEEIEEVIEEQEMPLWYYLPLHPEAGLDDADRERLVAWARELRAGLPAASDDHEHHDH
jgi:hypothetical protein